MYHHRARHNVVIAGNYLYIDGGEISTWDGTGGGIEGYSNDSNIVTLPDNSTHSIDLSTSWTNATVTVNQISKPDVPVLVGLALWADASGDTFYAYNGGISRSLPARELPNPPSNSLWQFQPSGSQGTWKQISPPTSSNFTSLVRTELGAYTSANGVGFALGGYRSYTTDKSVAGFQPNPGLILYNSTTQEWLNVSSKGYSPDGMSTNAGAWFIPTFGQQGLLAIMGGQSANSIGYYSMDSISFFDLATQSWSSQGTTGTSPAPSNVACMVGARGDNGTYEIFYYGGLTSVITTTVSNNAVYVLSLPSFHWQRSTSLPGHYGRFHHHCVVKARQMISVGGIVKTNYSESVSPGESFTDPWSEGLGVFDMTAMAWKDSYDADAADYVTPDIVKEHYAANGQYPSSWDSDEIETWFKTQATTTNPSSSDTGSSGSGSNKSASGGSNTGAIAGGVVGGVVALLAVVALIWMYRRRRRVRTPPRQPVKNDREPPPGYRDKPELEATSNDPETHELRKPELDSDSPVNSWTRHPASDPKTPSDREPVYEMSSQALRREAGGRDLYELH